MEKFNLLDLNDDALEEIAKTLHLSDQINLSKVCKRTYELCIGIWRRSKFYCDIISYPKDDLNFEDYNYYICLMCDHITGLDLRTTDIEDFCKATINKELPKLKAISFNQIKSTGALPSISFIKNFTNLEKISLTQPVLSVYFDEIMQIQNLKALEVIRYFKDFDKLVKKVIDQKQNVIKKIYSEVAKFPPCWLSGENTFANLKELGIMAQHYNSCVHEYMMPPLLNLKTLYLYGRNYGHSKMIGFVGKCKNLERIILHKPCGMEVLISDDLLDMSFDQYVLSENTIEFRKMNCQKVFKSPVLHTRFNNNRASIVFM